MEHHGQLHCNIREQHGVATVVVLEAGEELVQVRPVEPPMSREHGP